METISSHDAMAAMIGPTVTDLVNQPSTWVPSDCQDATEHTLELSPEEVHELESALEIFKSQSCVILCCACLVSLAFWKMPPF
jgi:hypothetical protein